MGRLTRNTAILAKIETSYGQDAVSGGGAGAILISNQSLNPLNAKNVDRALIRPYLGASEQLVGTAYKEVTFDVEYQSSGTAGVAPAWGPLLRACGWSENVLATPARVEYLPISTGFESVTLYYYADGAVHKLLGARGDGTLKATVGTRPVFSFKFYGLDGGIAEGTPGAVDLSAFKTPLVVTDANTSDIAFGCTYAAGALTGGTSYPSKGIEIPFGVAVNHTPLVGGESIDITGRDATGKVSLDLTAAQEVTFLNYVKAATLQSLGFVHGTEAGLKMLAYAPGAQFINPKHEDYNGRLMNAYDLRVTPVSGNDEIRIVAL